MPSNVLPSAFPISPLGKLLYSAERSFCSEQNVSVRTCEVNQRHPLGKAQLWKDS